MNAYDLVYGNFFTRANGTCLENNYEILTNLYLVLKNGRLAYLFQKGDGGIRTTKEMQTVQNIISTIYPEFQKTFQKRHDAYFYHIHNLPLRHVDENEDVWVGRVLEFDCPGDLQNDKKKTYGVSYQINVGEVKTNFYTEICIQVDKQKIKNRLRLWNDIIKTLEPTYFITVEIKPIIPSSLFIDAVKGKNIQFLNKYRREFINWLFGVGSTPIAELLEDKWQIKKYHSYILVNVIIAEHDFIKMSFDKQILFDKKDREFIQMNMNPLEYLLSLLNAMDKLEIGYDCQTLKMVVKEIENNVKQFD